MINVDVVWSPVIVLGRIIVSMGVDLNGTGTEEGSVRVFDSGKGRMADQQMPLICGGLHFERSSEPPDVAPRDRKRWSGHALEVAGALV